MQVEHYANVQPSFNATKHWYAHQGIKFNNEHDTPDDRLADEAAVAVEKDDTWVARRQRFPPSFSTLGLEKAESKPGISASTEGGSVSVPEPQSATKPLIKILSFEEAGGMLSDESGDNVVRCGICEAVAEGDDGFGGAIPMPRPRGSREVIIQHVIDV
jgi:hypothetical protein